jgi:hypothetical protein
MHNGRASYDAEGILAQQCRPSQNPAVYDRVVCETDAKFPEAKTSRRAQILGAAPPAGLHPIKTLHYDRIPVSVTDIAVSVLAPSLRQQSF